MIWSVSTSARGKADTPPSMMRTGSIRALGSGLWALGSANCQRPTANPLGPLPNVDEPALDRRRRGHLGADEVAAGAAALPALEVSVGSRGDALARRGDVGVHAQAHRAAGGAPVEARRAEDLVEPLGLGLGLHLLRAGDDHGVDVLRDLATVDQLGRR